MKKLYFFVLLTLLSLSDYIFSQDVNLLWAKQMGGTSNESGVSITVDASGSVFTTGSFKGTADFDPGTGIYNLTSAGQGVVFVSKLDASGNFVWAKQLGGTSLAYGYSITVDDSGNVYTTGIFYGTADFDPGTETYNLTSAGFWDIFVSKLDASGNFVWAKQLGGIGSDEVSSIAVDALGNVYTTGEFVLTADFDPGTGTYNLTSYESFDIFVSKLDASGNFVWAKQFRGTYIDFGFSIAVDASGNVFTTGTFWETTDFDPGIGTYNLTSAGQGDIFVSKLDASGNFVWAKQLGGTSYEDGNYIALDASGNVYTTGSFHETADFDPGIGIYNLVGVEGSDRFVSKLDASGNFVWAKQLGGTSVSDIGKSIALDALGNVYSTGVFYETTDFDPGTGTYNLTSAGNKDIFITKLNASGNFEWSIQLGGTSDDVGYSIALDDTGNVYTTGSFYGTADFDPGAEAFYLTSSGNSYDIFVHKLGQGIAEPCMVSGVVTDALTGLAIEAAMVSLTGNIQANSPTNSSGNYWVYNVPFGVGYHLFASAIGFTSKELTGIDLTDNYPSITVNVNLTPSSNTPVFVELSPNPNPVISTIGMGGTAHRYYFTKDSQSGEPAPQVHINVSDTLGNEYTFQSDASGIVDIYFPSNQIGGSVGAISSFSITKVNDAFIDPPIVFTCEVVNPEYKKYWDSKQFGKLGVSFLSFESERGSSVVLTENDINSSGAETLDVTRQGRAGIGVDFSVGAAAVVYCGDVVAGGEATAGAGGSVSGVTEDYYQFPHQNFTSNEALVQYLLFADGNYTNLDNVLIRLYSALEEIFNEQSTIDEAHLGDKKGLDVMVGASAQAAIGVNTGIIQSISANANVGVNSHATRNVIHHQQLSEREDNFGLNVSLSNTIVATNNLTIPIYDNDNHEVINWKQEFQQRLIDYEIGGTFGYELSIFTDKQTDEFHKYILKFLLRNKPDGWEEVYTYEISGNDLYNATQTLREQFTQVNSLSNSTNSSGNISISNNFFQPFLTALFNQMYNMQVNEQGNVTINYQKEIKQITDIDGFPVKVKIKLLSPAVSAQIGGGVGFEEGKMMVSEKGKWVRGHHLALESYNNNIPPINEQYKDVVQDIVDGISIWTRITLGFLNTFSWAFREESVFNITDSISNDTMAYISFPPESLPTTIDSINCVSWGWYGASARQMLSKLSPKAKQVYKSNRSRAEESFGMKYGIGGFYQLEPLDTLLLDTAYMTIIYTDSMVVDIDESSLGMYKEDKSNHSWIYVGGIVDADLNTVTAPITDLALYTLAPAMPLGAFNLYPAADSLYADSVSTALVTSGIIHNNNTDTVSDGELFTVNTEAGYIVTTDADTDIDGIQVEAVGGAISFTIKSSHIAAQPRISAFSVLGSAQADTSIIFYDTIAPAAPVGLAQIAANEKVYLTWSQNTEEDISGYIIYYDADTAGPPYEGVATVYGFPSPIIIGVDSSFVVTGLRNDTTYYFSIKAYDISGNESDYSAYVSSTPRDFKNQQIDLLSGWNIASFNVAPDQIRLDSILKPLMNSNTLVKVVNESGGFIQYIPGLGWLNTIGNMAATEGYYTKVNANSQLNLTGLAVSTPFDITLNLGWNIMGYPLNQSQNALTALQALTDNNQLIKVVNESGGFIQYIPGLGWLNTIGNFTPGEGYYIKVTESTSISLDLPPLLKVTPDVMPTPPVTLFSLPNENNPYYPMNILVTDISVEGIEVKEGDEVAVFDKGLCVGAGVIVSYHGVLLAHIIASMDDPLTEIIDGYADGNQLSFKFLSKSLKQPIDLYPALIWGDRGFEPLGTLVCSLSDNALSVQENYSKNLFMNCYPNPTTGQLTIDYILNEDGEVQIELMDMYGNKVDIVEVGERDSGNHQIKYNMTTLSFGVYMLRMNFKNEKGSGFLIEKVVKQ